MLDAHAVENFLKLLTSELFCAIRTSHADLGSTLLQELDKVKDLLRGIGLVLDGKATTILSGLSQNGETVGGSAESGPLEDHDVPNHALLLLGATRELSGRSIRHISGKIGHASLASVLVGLFDVLLSHRSEAIDKSLLESTKVSRHANMTKGSMLLNGQLHASKLGITYDHGNISHAS